MNAPANLSSLRLYQIADDYLTALEAVTITVASHIQHVLCRSRMKVSIEAQQAISRLPVLTHEPIQSRRSRFNSSSFPPSAF